MFKKIFRKQPHKPNGSCLNQLIAATHQVFSSFDDMPSVKLIFQDMTSCHEVRQKETI